eukprot:gnl/TRDRNA2_/TRDRNA2_135488_c2_seq1.p1 gnl/TRDRNA2_/TRDRNA2_135488_c2~~gnl/TRDRNA2_/TRDRNA2_135488_c2_seq1.p1  ORF type:complete len:914 (-),score=138.55 gnl/TRDRNA2_/TRDRNA2_135488_c2_seq1:190-2910(-)
MPRSRSTTPPPLALAQQCKQPTPTEKEHDWSPRDSVWKRYFSQEDSMPPNLQSMQQEMPGPGGRSPVNERSPLVTPRTTVSAGAPQSSDLMHAKRMLSALSCGSAGSTCSGREGSARDCSVTTSLTGSVVAAPGTNSSNREGGNPPSLPPKGLGAAPKRGASGGLARSPSSDAAATVPSGTASRSESPAAASTATSAVLRSYSSCSGFGSSAQEGGGHLASVESSGGLLTSASVYIELGSPLPTPQAEQVFASRTSLEASRSTNAPNPTATAGTGGSPPSRQHSRQQSRQSSAPGPFVSQGEGLWSESSSVKQETPEATGGIGTQMHMPPSANDREQTRIASKGVDDSSCKGASTMPFAALQEPPALASGSPAAPALVRRQRSADAAAGARSPLTSSARSASIGGTPPHRSSNSGGCQSPSLRHLVDWFGRPPQHPPEAQGDAPVTAAIDPGPGTGAVPELDAPQYHSRSGTGGIGTQAVGSWTTGSPPRVSSNGVDSGRKKSHTSSERVATGNDVGAADSLSKAHMAAAGREDVDRALAETAATASKVEIRDLAELRSFRQPPAAVCQVLEALSAILGLPEAPWLTMRKRLDVGLLQRIAAFDSTAAAQIPKARVEKLQQLLLLPVFGCGALHGKCPPAAPLAAWCAAAGRLVSALQMAAPASDDATGVGAASAVGGASLARPAHRVARASSSPTSCLGCQSPERNTPQRAFASVRASVTNSSDVPPLPGPLPSGSNAPARSSTPGSASGRQHSGRDAGRRNATPPPEVLRGLSVMPELWRLTDSELSRVRELRIGREGVGYVTFHGETDCRGLMEHIPNLIIIGQGEVVVYPDARNKPPIGQGLNKPASVVLYGCMPKSTQRVMDERARERYKQRVAQMTKEKGAIFQDYNCDDGTWKFAVDHF